MPNLTGSRRGDEADRPSDARLVTSAATPGTASAPARPKGPVRVSPDRIYALDALRGLAILGMILSAQLPFGQSALPAWMYHAQVPPPDHQWVANLAGITWVDLVFPFFIFSMGAAIPLALTRRLERGEPKWKVALFVIERGVLLAFFAVYVLDIRPYDISHSPTFSTWLLAMAGFALLFPILTRLPKSLSANARWGIRILGWTAALWFLCALPCADGTGFGFNRDALALGLGRNDIIIVVLANLVLFGSFAWWLTRSNLLVRLGLLGILIAFRLSNMPRGIPGWVAEVWRWSPEPWLSWIYKLYYLQYLFILIPGTIAGDLLLKAVHRPPSAPSATPQPAAWNRWRLGSIAGLMLGLVFLLVAGLFSRWLLGTTLLTFALCGLGWWLLRKPATDFEILFHRLFNWGIYWLVLGLCFEPYEGGIKKDRATMSYYFVTAGLALCLLIALLILVDVFRRKHWVQFLIDNGQNPMIAYAGINSLVIPVLALTGVLKLLAHLEANPWLGFLKGVFITALLALSVSFFTRKRIFWRT